MVLERQLEQKQADLTRMERYAGANTCRRTGLLAAFDERPQGYGDPEACCENCNGGAAPWLEETTVTPEMLEEVYGVRRVLLEFLEDDEREYTRKSFEKAYTGKGLSRLKMILRGESVRNRHTPGGKIAITLHPYEQLSRFFGRLEFIGEKELDRGLLEAERGGLVAHSEYQAGRMYCLTPQGRQFLHTLRNRTVRERIST